MNITERFIKYVSFDTQSDEDGKGCPSTKKQTIFAKFLYEELKNIGLADVKLDENGYLYATLPSNIDKEVPTIGFISHLDTSPDCSGKDVKPRIIKDYKGDDIELSEGMVLSPQKFPELLNHVNEDLIVTDGHTLLGADDKAGIAEIVQAMTYLLEHPEIKHGKIRIAFTPTKRLEWVHIYLMLKVLDVNGHILSTEVKWENWNMRISMLHLLKSTLMAVRFIQAMLRAK